MDQPTKATLIDVPTSRVGDRRLDRTRSDLRSFLRKKRANLTPTDVGIPTGGRRRTPGLRREEVAVLAGVGVSWYTWLEQGRNINVSAEVLDAISHTLQLDEQERAYIYRLTGNNPPTPGERPDDPLSPTLSRLLKGWLPNPAFLMDRYWNIPLSNSAAQKVFGLAKNDNCIVSFFTETTYRSRHEHWESLATAVVSEFRQDYARYPGDPGLERLLERMLTISPEFADLWHKHDVRSTPVRIKAISHPEAGHLEFEPSLMNLPSYPHVRLIAHIPLSRATAQRVEALLD